MSKRVFTRAIVRENRALNADTWLLRLETPAVADMAEPGQFVMLSVNERKDPLLNRPLGIADVVGGCITVIYRVVGQGTRLLTEKKADDYIGIIGPLGKGFDLSAKKPLLVGGGMGLAPLLYVARALSDRPFGVVAGARNKEEMFWPTLFGALCDEVHVTTDDGSLGTKGNCTTVLPQVVRAGGFDAILACGPEPMLKAVAAEAEALEIMCQVSLEKYMACGFGVCLTCTCEGKDGTHLQVCKAGPVFNAEEVKL